MKITTFLCLASIWISVPSLVWAINDTEAPADAPRAPSNPCTADPSYRDFDFWLGEWEVWVGQTKAGDNLVTREEKGCLILERWTDAGGNTGQSYNFYDPESKQWRQVWASSAMIIDYAGGLDADGSMQLEGEVVYHANQQRTGLKGRWTPLADGTVEQHFEQWDAENETWIPVFTGLYRRKGTGPPPQSTVSLVQP